MLEDLIARIDELGGEDVYPVVPLDLFFDGNDDPASFAPNLEPHPGIPRVYEVLRSIEQRPDVSIVVVQIDDPADDYGWASTPVGIGRRRRPERRTFQAATNL